MKDQMSDALSTISGLELASNYKKGKQLVEERNFVENAAYFQNCFEIARWP